MVLTDWLLCIIVLEKRCWYNFNEKLLYFSVLIIEICDFFEPAILRLTRKPFDL